MEKPTLNDWVWVLAMLNQALLGVISTNVRQICLCYENDWVIKVILENSCDEDVDDFEDIAIETSIFMVDIENRLSESANAKVSASFHVSNGPIEGSQTRDCRIVYERKEVAKS